MLFRSYIGRLKFLGYGFYVRNGKCRLRLHQKTEAKLRRRLKAITSRSNGMGYAKRKDTLRQYLRGWTEYYNLVDMGEQSQGDRPMAAPSYPYVYMEIVETQQNARPQPDTLRHRQTESLRMGQHKQGILAHSPQLDTDAGTTYGQASYCRL